MDYPYIYHVVISVYFTNQFLQLELLAVQVLVREQEILYWTISDVPDQRLLSLTVLIMALTFITVVTVKMLEQFALVRPVFCAILYTMFFIIFCITIAIYMEACSIQDYNII